MHVFFRAALVGLSGWVMHVASGADALKLATPSPSTEAVQLYGFLQDISGKHTLSGQHNVPMLGSLRLQAVQKVTGKYPAVFGQDFGFSAPGTWDGINYRQQIVDEAIRRHEQGFIVTLMWHAVRPTDDEPVVFEKSIQGKLTAEEWDELVTPGSALHERWQSQVDVIAWHLRQLRDARVPVLWRPYHEMNGGWFWWGKKAGENGYKKLWRMLFVRLVEFHRLDNLIWVFNANEVRAGIDSYETYFPGHDVVDVLATDVYRGGFAAHDYDGLLALAAGKPIALGEVGHLPTPEKLKAQPRWAWFMAWGDPGGEWQDYRAMRAIYESEHVWNRDELPGVKDPNPTVHHPVLK